MTTEDKSENKEEKCLTRKENKDKGRREDKMKRKEWRKRKKTGKKNNKEER